MKRNVHACTPLDVTMVVLDLIDVVLNLVQGFTFGNYVFGSFNDDVDSKDTNEGAHEENPKFTPQVQPLLVQDDGSTEHIEENDGTLINWIHVNLIVVSHRNVQAVQLNHCR
jgi:hypothetical protein